ncbi:MAG: glycosyltransferase family 39 protein [Ferruginibacter sp.]
MKSKNKFFVWLTFLVFLCCLLPVAFFTYKHPAYNFDMLGYMALVARMDQTSDLDEVHRIAYDNARQVLPPEEYEKLTEIPSYREKFATDPSQFKKILPNYVVKPLYIWMCWLFYKAGFSLPAATVMPSVLSFLIIGLFLLYWLRKYLQDIVAFLAALLIMLSIFTVAIAGLSTPDCLSALFLFTSTYFILEKKNLAWMSFFFFLSILTRVDNVITCFFIISFLTFSEKWKSISKKQYFLMLLALATTYLCIILPVTQFGWSIFYYSQYARHIDYSRDFDQAVSFSSYLALVYSKLVTALVSTHFTIFLFLALLIIGNTGFSFRKFSFDQSFLLLLMFIIFFRFLLLPDLSDRFYFGFYLIIIMLLVRKFFPQISTVSHEDS